MGGEIGEFHLPRILPFLKDAGQVLCGFRSPGTPLQCALREIDFLAALAAFMRPVELVGKDLFCGAASGALAGKRLEVFEAGETWTMLRCRGHSVLLSVLLGSIKRTPSSWPPGAHNHGPSAGRLRAHWI